MAARVAPLIDFDSIVPTRDASIYKEDPRILNITAGGLFKKFPSLREKIPTSHTT